MSNTTTRWLVPRARGFDAATIRLGRGFPAAPLADSLVESTVFRWLKKAGDRVRKGEPLVEIETDMVKAELESPVEGVLAEIVAPEGKTAAVGAVIARLAEREGA